MIRIVLVFFFIISTVFADKLEIKVDGKSIDLQHWPAQKEHYGAVILLNGGSQTQSTVLLDHLANQLAANGWLVVLLNNDQTRSIPWIKQLPAAMTTLRQQKSTRIVLLHYGEQLKQTLDYLSKPPLPEIEGCVMLSAFDVPPSSDKLPQLHTPLFDIAGQFDYDLVKQEMTLRQKVFSQNDKYLAIEIPGAHHDYEYSHQLLFSFIHGWMMKLPEFQPNPPPVMYSYLHPVYPVHPLAVSEVAEVEESDWSGYLEHPPELD